MKEKFTTFPQDHQLPSKDEIKGKVYYKYHNSWNHSINSYWSFKNVIEDSIKKKVTVKFFGEKEVTVKFSKEKEVTVKFSKEKEVTTNFPGEKEVTMKFFGEKEVTRKFPKEKEVMVKPFGGKEVMMIDEDPFPPTASINIVATNWRAMLNAKKAGRFLPSDRVRKVWILKQYLTYKNDLAVKGRVLRAKEWKKWKVSIPFI